MATEYPPLGKSYVISYSNNDKDFPIIAIKKDPRVDNYKRPDDLSPHPDSVRYPNHVFTGTQPTNTDERVIWIYEILPSPWVPFTRYDDDLGPIQGRRRSVANTGQEASLERDKRVSYEAREGSAIVSTELEETWDAGSLDPDKPSPFPIRDRDFYDPSRGAVQERRQLIPTTGNEVATLENNNGVITQTSYEAYNEFLSFKIVQTYSVDGPQLVGSATNNEGQLVTVTTQRKAADYYFPPQPTATRTVEANREDAESIVERIVDTPEVFANQVYRATKEDLTPQKFKGAQSDATFEQTVEGTASSPSLGTGEFVKSEEQINKFLKRVSTTSRIIATTSVLNESVLTNEGQVGTRVLTLASGQQTFTPSATLVDASVEALGDGRTVKSETRVPNVFAGKTITKTKPDLTPEKFKAQQEDTITEESVAGTINENIDLEDGEFRKSEQQVTEFVKRISTTSRDISAATDLTEYILTPQGQLAEKRLRLSADPQAIQPDAKLIDGSIEALGDGRTVKTEVRVGQIFDNKTVSASKPEILPERFRASVAAETIQEIVEQQSVETPTLEEGDLEKTEERITEFTVRKSTTSRNIDEVPELNGIDYEESFDVQIPYTEKISETLPSGSAEAIPLDDTRYLVREYDPNEIESYLSSFLQTYPTTINMNLPKVLESITVEWDEKQQTGEYVNAPFAGGVLYQFSSSDKGESSSFHSATPLVSLNFKDVWSKNIPATSHVFFLKNPVTEADILAKTASQKWPTFKPKSHVITGKGVEVRATASAAVSVSIQQNKPEEFGIYADQSGQKDYSRSVTPITVDIPPCLHGGFNINSSRTLTATANTQAITASYGIFNSLLSQSSASVSDVASISGSSGPTDPPSIPISGVYLIESNVEFFKYGFSIVKAITIDASVFA